MLKENPGLDAGVQKLSEEYNLPSIDRTEVFKQYNFSYTGYDGPRATAEEKICSPK